MDLFQSLTVFSDSTFVNLMRENTGVFSSHFIREAVENSIHIRRVETCWQSYISNHGLDQSKSQIQLWHNFMDYSKGEAVRLVKEVLSELSDGHIIEFTPDEVTGEGAYTFYGVYGEDDSPLNGPFRVYESGAVVGRGYGEAPASVYLFEFNQYRSRFIHREIEKQSRVLL